MNLHPVVSTQRLNRTTIVVVSFQFAKHEGTADASTVFSSLLKMRQQAEDLRKRAKEHREREEKALERNREAERIRIGKEMMAAKRLEEEQVRSCSIPM